MSVKQLLTVHKTRGFHAIVLLGLVLVFTEVGISMFGLPTMTVNHCPELDGLVCPSSTLNPEANWLGWAVMYAGAVGFVTIYGVCMRWINS